MKAHRVVPLRPFVGPLHELLSGTLDMTNPVAKPRTFGPDVDGRVEPMESHERYSLPSMTKKRSMEIATITPWPFANRPTMLPIGNRTIARLGLGSRALPDNTLGRAYGMYARRAH